MVMGYSGINTKGVQTIWEKLVENYGSEISVLTDADIDLIMWIGGTISTVGIQDQNTDDSPRRRW